MCFLIPHIFPHLLLDEIKRVRTLLDQYWVVGRLSAPPCRFNLLYFVSFHIVELITKTLWRLRITVA